MCVRMLLRAEDVPPIQPCCECPASLLLLVAHGRHRSGWYILGRCTGLLSSSEHVDTSTWTLKIWSLMLTEDSQICVLH